MNILITGAGGFVGKNLTAALENIRDGKDKTRDFGEIELMLYDIDTPPESSRNPYLKKLIENQEFTL